MSHSLSRVLFPVLILAGCASLADAQILPRNRVAPSPAAPPVAAPAPKAAPVADDIPAHHKLLYGIARNRAAAEHAKAKGITRKEARDKIDQIDDATLHAAAMAAGIVVKPLPVAAGAGGGLQNLLDWLSAHSDQIMALVKLILSLLALFG